MLVHVVSDVHGNAADLARAADGAEALVVLGDLLDFVDYDDPAQGILAEILGPQAHRRVRAAALRGRTWGAAGVHAAALGGRRRPGGAGRRGGAAALRADVRGPRGHRGPGVPDAGQRRRPRVVARVPRGVPAPAVGRRRGRRDRGAPGRLRRWGAAAARARAAGGGVPGVHARGGGVRGGGGGARGRRRALQPRAARRRRAGLRRRRAHPRADLAHPDRARPGAPSPAGALRPRARAAHAAGPDRRTPSASTSGTSAAGGPPRRVRW